jgi:hypothetical protein
LVERCTERPGCPALSIATQGASDCLNIGAELDGDRADDRRVSRITSAVLLDL